MRELVREHTGIALSEAKRQLVYGRLARRLRALKIESFAEYIELIEGGDPAELEEFMNAVTTNLTSFFREPHHFEYLAREALPAIAARATRAYRLRIWCCAASTGEEPYSIAMVLREAQERLAGWDVKMLATDLDSAVLATGAAGVYATERFQGMDPKRVARFFDKGSGAQAGKFARPRRAAQPHHLQAAQSHARVADARAVRRDLLPQRDHLFRQGHAAHAVRTHGDAAASRRPAVPRPFGEPVPRQRTYELIGRTIYRRLAD